MNLYIINALDFNSLALNSLALNTLARNKSFLANFINVLLNIMHRKVPRDRTIYFLRHAQTDWNLQQQLQGRNDVALNQIGKHQAAIVADIMAELPISNIICSPLLRARQTLEQLGLNVPVRFDPIWQELSIEAQEDKRFALSCKNLEQVPSETLLISHGSVFETLCRSFGLPTIKLNNCELISISSKQQLEQLYPGFAI